MRVARRPLWMDVLDVDRYYVSVRCDLFTCAQIMVVKIGIHIIYMYNPILYYQRRYAYS